MLRGVRLFFVPQGTTGPNPPFIGPAGKKKRWSR